MVYLTTTVFTASYNN